MIDRVFSVKGNKISSFLADEYALKFSSASSETTVDAFRSSFAKKITFNTKVEIKYDAIKSIQKEDLKDDIVIKYRVPMGLPGECNFTFSDPADVATFFTYMEKDRYFKKVHETMSPLQANKTNLSLLALTLLFTLLTYLESRDLANGTGEDAINRKGRFIRRIAEMLGEKGVFLVATVVSAYILYRMWRRMKQQPTRTKLIPPHA